jgi:hypothetical protein
MSAESLYEKLANRWVGQGLEVNDIVTQTDFILLSIDERDATLKYFHKLKTERRQQQGFIWMGVGAFLGFIGCVLSMVNPLPNLFYVFLYGFSTLSIIIAFVGLYLVFE